MRYLFGFLCVCTLGVMPLVGCSEAAGDGGNGGTGGMTGQEFPCTEQGIRDAIAEGGGPHTFACDGPQTVVTEAEIVIDNDVILDGEGNLTVDGSQAELVGERYKVFSIARNVQSELRGFKVTKGRVVEGATDSAAIEVGPRSPTDRDTILTLVDCTVSGNSGAGVATFSPGESILVNTTVSGNSGSGILNSANTALINSTVSGNNGDGIRNGGFLTLTNSTVSGNDGIDVASAVFTITMTNSLIDGDCSDVPPGLGDFVSNGYNVESPGDTCAFDQTGDQPNVSADDLNLGPLQNNGGPTQTHALLPGSVAIDQIPEAECVDAEGNPLTTDQRGEPRPVGDGCDVGAFEVTHCTEDFTGCMLGDVAGGCLDGSCRVFDCAGVEDGTPCIDTDLGDPWIPGICTANDCAHL